MKVDRASYMGSIIYWLGCHHRCEIEFLEAGLAPEHVLVDAGANTGEFTLACATRTPLGRVLAFEPHSDVRSVLRENVDLNGFSNVSIFDFGLAEQTEEVQFFSPADVDGVDGFNEGLYTRYAGDRQNVACGSVFLRPFDEVAREEGLVRLDWMKVDIEGGELSMLRGAAESLAAWHPKLILEINQPMFRIAGYGTQDLVNFLRRYGYRPFSIGRHGRLAPCDPVSLGGRSANVLFSCDT